MSAPDIQDLYTRYLRVLGGSSNSPKSPPSMPLNQPRQFGVTVTPENHPASGGYRSGGVLGALSMMTQGIPARGMGAITPPVPVPTGLRGISPLRRFGVQPGVSGFVPGSTVEIPNPHLDRFVPQTTRDIWTAAALLPWILRGKLTGEDPSRETPQEQVNSRSSEDMPQPPVLRPGGQPPWIMGPAILDAARGRKEALDTEEKVEARPDSQQRELKTVEPDSQVTEIISLAPDPSMIGWRKKLKGKGGRIPGGRSVWKVRPNVGFGNNGPGGKGPGENGDDDDFCSSRRRKEDKKCSKRWRDGEYAHKDFYWGCKERAKTRWEGCYKNGGTPPDDEPAEWSLDPDEELYINIDG